MTISERETKPVDSRCDSAKEVLWRERIKQWEAGGLSQAEYCRSNNLNKHTFQFWRTHILRRDAVESGLNLVKLRLRATSKPRRSAGRKKKKTTQFVPVTLSEHPHVQVIANEIGLTEHQTVSVEITTPKGFIIRIPIETADTASLFMVLSAVGMVSC